MSIVPDEEPQDLVDELREEIAGLRTRLARAEQLLAANAELVRDGAELATKNLQLAERSTAVLAEKTAECERWRSILHDADTTPASEWAIDLAAAKENAAGLGALLAESQADVARLREVLEEVDRIACRCAGGSSGPEIEPPEPANRDGQELAELARAALALKADNAALVEVCERVATAAFVAQARYEAEAREARGVGVVAFRESAHNLVARVLKGEA